MSSLELIWKSKKIQFNSVNRWHWNRVKYLPCPSISTLSKSHRIFLWIHSPTKSLYIPLSTKHNTFIHKSNTKTKKVFKKVSIIFKKFILLWLLLAQKPRSFPSFLLFRLCCWVRAWTPLGRGEWWWRRRRWWRKTMCRRWLWSIWEKMRRSCSLQDFQKECLFLHLLLQNGTILLLQTDEFMNSAAMINQSCLTLDYHIFFPFFFVSILC